MTASAAAKTLGELLWRSTLEHRYTVEVTRTSQFEAQLDVHDTVTGLIFAPVRIILPGHHLNTGPAPDVAAWIELALSLIKWRVER